MQCKYTLDKGIFYYPKVYASLISSNNLIFMRVYYSKLTNAERRYINANETLLLYNCIILISRRQHNQYHSLKNKIGQISHRYIYIYIYIYI